MGEVEVPRCHRAKNPVDQEAKQHNQKKINDNQQPSRDKRKRLPKLYFKYLLEASIEV
jgi:hypothetical protein